MFAKRLAARVGVSKVGGAGCCRHSNRRSERSQSAAGSCGPCGPSHEPTLADVDALVREYRAPVGDDDLMVRPKLERPAKPERSRVLSAEPVVRVTPSTRRSTPIADRVLTLRHPGEAGEGILVASTIYQIPLTDRFGQSYDYLYWR